MEPRISGHPCFSSARSELIVVDNSDDDTVEIVRGRRSCRTLVLHCGESVTVARKKTRGQRWLLFADADVRFAAGYFSTLSEFSWTGRVHAPLFGSKLSADDYAGHYRRLSIAQGVFARLQIPELPKSFKRLPKPRSKLPIFFPGIAGKQCVSRSLRELYWKAPE